MRKPCFRAKKDGLKALLKNGFVYVTDGFGKRPYLRHGLVFLPIAVKQTDCLKKKDGYSTLVFHTNTMDEKDFIRYEKMFEENKESLIPYAEYLKQTDNTEKQAA